MTSKPTPACAPPQAPESAERDVLTMFALRFLKPRQWIGHWIGYWLKAVAAIHTAFGLVVFRNDLLAMARLGFFDTVGQDSRRAAVAFFLLFGFLLAVLAQATTAMERSGQYALLRHMGWSLLLLCGVALLLMPASGFWLACPTLWALLRKPDAW